MQADGSMSDIGKSCWKILLHRILDKKTLLTPRGRAHRPGIFMNRLVRTLMRGRRKRVVRLAFFDAEQPPSFELLTTAGLSLKINPRCPVGGGDHLKPMFSDIHFGTAVPAWPGFAPGSKDGGNAQRLAPPDKRTGQARPARRHCIQVGGCSNGPYGL